MIYLLKPLVIMEGLLLIAITLFRLCVRPQHRAGIGAGDVATMLLIPPVGLFGHDKNVFYAFLFLMPLTWAGDPARLAKRYCLTLVVFPELWQILSIGGVFLGTWSALLSFNLGALVSLAMTSRRGMRPASAIDAAMGGIFLIALLMSVRGLPVAGVLRYVWTTFLLVMVPYLVVSRSITSPRVMIDTVAFAIFGGVANAIIATFEGVKHWALYEVISGALNVRTVGGSANLAMRAGLLRAGGATLNYEALGLITGSAIVGVIALRRHFSPAGHIVVLGTLALGLFASQARSAWLATVIGLILYLAYERRWSRAAGLVAGAAAAAVLLSVASPNGGRIDQLLGNSGHGESTGEYRQRLATRSIEEARRHPLTGQTLDQIQVSMNDLRQGEKIIDFVNTHLFVLLVGGVGALLAWLVAWLTPLVRGWRASGGRRAGTTLIALPGALLGMTFVFLTFTSPIDRILSLVGIEVAFMGVALRLASLARNPAAPAWRGADARMKAVAVPAGVVPTRA